MSCIVSAVDTGSVYTWGNGRRGQLGHGRGGVSHTTSPKLGNLDSILLFGTFHIDLLSQLIDFGALSV